MVRKLLRATESLLEKVKSESDQNKLTFNITYYPIFQNVRIILQELQILLTPDKEQKGLNHVWKGTVRFLTLYAIQTLFLPKPLMKHLKYKVGYLTLRRSFISWIVEYVGKLLMLERQKRNSEQDFIIIKTHTGLIKKNYKVSQQRFYDHYGQ